MLDGNTNIKKIQTKLLNWYNSNKRNLPFRQTKDPYKIWLSEIMLQQTTVATVLDYYNRFIKKYPDIQSVAQASEQDLLCYWQGLGYYSRIRNFQKSCKKINLDFSGKLPRDYKTLLDLPGIGEYTASAISSICFNKKYAVVDGNVKRVIARLNYYCKDINLKESKNYFKTHADNLLDTTHPGDFNQAMMEIGAIICTPKKPRCAICPLDSFCKAKNNNAEGIPKKIKKIYIKKKYETYIIHTRKNILLKTPHKENLIRDMWELPSYYDKKENGQTLLSRLKSKKLKKIGQVRHSITNKKITSYIYEWMTTESCLTKLKLNGFNIVPKNKLGTIPVNTLSQKVLVRYLTAGK